MPSSAACERSRPTCAAACAADPDRPRARTSAQGHERVTRPIEIHRLADEELMDLVAAGDARAFEAVYDRHGGAAFSVAYRMVGNRSVAEDIVQEAFLSIWRSRLRYRRERGSVRTWVLGIVHHRGIDALRRNLVHERRRTTAEGLEEQQEAPERTDVEAARRDEARAVRRALDELPDGQGQVIELAYFGGFTHTQIAEMLGMPVGTVKGRMRLGLEKLRRTLGPEVAWLAHPSTRSIPRTSGRTYSARCRRSRPPPSSATRCPASSARRSSTACGPRPTRCRTPSSSTSPRPRSSAR